MADELREVRIRQSALGRARGSGSAKFGAGHWQSTRMTSIALVPLTLWFVFNVVALAGAPQEEVRHWAGRPWNSALLLALIAMTFHHMQLGIQVVLEDYVHHKWAMSLGILATKAICGILGLLSALAVLKMAVL